MSETIALDNQCPIGEQPVIGTSANKAWPHDREVEEGSCLNALEGKSPLALALEYKKTIAEKGIKALVCYNLLRIGLTATIYYEIGLRGANRAFAEAIEMLQTSQFADRENLIASLEQFAAEFGGIANSPDYKQLICRLALGIITLPTGASFWALMASLGVRSAYRKINNDQGAKV